MESVYKNWNDYVDRCEAEALLEDIWSGRYIQKDLILEIDQQRQLLEEGVGAFFSGAYNAVKSKIEDLTTWADNKLQSFIDAGLTKLVDFLSFLRSKGIFKKYEARGMQEVIKVFKRPQYLQAAASMIMILSQKLAELGAKALLDMMTAGAGAAAKAANWIKDNIEKVKLFVEAIKNFFDPDGLIQLLSQAFESNETLNKYSTLLIKLKDDLKDPHRAFKSGFNT
tara:strand:+ start:47 stop:721 length:675 start_codon:yes stop_codon:yes gene_type:complete